MSYSLALTGMLYLPGDFNTSEEADITLLYISGFEGPDHDYQLDSSLGSRWSTMS